MCVCFVWVGSFVLCVCNCNSNCNCVVCVVVCCCDGNWLVVDWIGLVCLVCCFVVCSVCVWY